MTHWLKRMVVIMALLAFALNLAPSAKTPPAAAVEAQQTPTGC